MRKKLFEDISVLKEDKPDIVTYMDHDPIFVGKIIDFLRLKQLQVLGLAKEPELPTVSDSQKKAFGEVVRYYSSLAIVQSSSWQMKIQK